VLNGPAVIKGCEHRIEVGTVTRREDFARLRGQYLTLCPRGLIVKLLLPALQDGNAILHGVLQIVGEHGPVVASTTGIVIEPA
jgi:hypothetical protein